MLQVILHRQAQKDVLRIPKKIRLRILGELINLEKLDRPLQHPHALKLGGRKTEDFRIRVGDHRIKFTLFTAKQILITSIEHRQAGY